MDLLTLPEAAALLRIKTGSLKNMVSQKKVPYTKPTGKLLFDRSDLEKMINEAKSPVETKEVAHG